MNKLIARVSALALSLVVAVFVALPAKAFYATSSVITDGQSLVTQGRGFITDIVIPYILPLVLALSVVAFVYRKIKGLGKIK